MTGNQLASVMKQTKGKVSVQILAPNEVIWVYAEKSDLIAWAKKQGGAETGLKLTPEDGRSGLFLETDYAIAH